MEICSPLKCKINTLPGMYQLLMMRFLYLICILFPLKTYWNVMKIHLDTSKVEPYLRDKVVLLRVQGGSIGSEICRQVLRVRPKNYCY